MEFRASKTGFNFVIGSLVMKNRPSQNQQTFAHEMFRALIIWLAICTTGCSHVFYSKTKMGEFSGKLYVEWIAPNKFIYRPDDSNPLSFVTSDGKRIQPKLMYTDGGSIPRLFWSSPNFGPWDFAPAYIIHDWLFVQHHCKSEDWDEYDLNASARILAEGMKSQMEKAHQAEPAVLYAVYEAVRTPTAARLWDTGTCATPALAPALSPGSPPAVSATTPIRLLTIDIH